ncbi:unnamed protein product [Phaedon cochleariae]|uniref:BED-type domain-containing protein n=1 Tax=Phaedon cochleariae TaxID=80249 RepID=A0A9N9SG78_PHACE|nr:unnamed protein product [Phaedon cochleariae]
MEVDAEAYMSFDIPFDKRDLVRNNEFYDGDIRGDPLEHEMNECEVNSGIENIQNRLFVEFLDDNSKPDLDLKDYSNKDVDTSENSPYLKMSLDKDRSIIIKKSTFVWLLDEGNGRVSSDRLKRFVVTKKRSSSTGTDAKASKQVKNKSRQESETDPDDDEVVYDDSTDTEHFSDDAHDPTEMNNSTQLDIELSQEKYYAVMLQVPIAKLSPLPTVTRKYEERRKKGAQKAIVVTWSPYKTDLEISKETQAKKKAKKRAKTIASNVFSKEKDEKRANIDEIEEAGPSGIGGKKKKAEIASSIAKVDIVMDNEEWYCFLCNETNIEDMESTARSIPPVASVSFSLLRQGSLSTGLEHIVSSVSGNTAPGGASSESGISERSIGDCACFLYKFVHLPVEVCKCAFTFRQNIGRKITSEAHQHFNYIQVEDKSVCKLCKDVIKGHHATNLKKHLIRSHNFTEDQFGTITSVNKSSNQPNVKEMNTIKIEITKEILIDACVELVTVNGRPFSLMEDSGFKKILEPIKAGLSRKTKDKHFSLSSESIQKYVTREADDVRRKIIEEVTNCMVSVKVDGVTRIDRSFLGINIQYIKNGQIVLRTLALKKITNQHTGANLKTMIMDACNSFQIGLGNIYSITTDNGSNLLKAIKIIASEIGEYDVIENEVDNDDQDEFSENIEIVVEDDSDMEGNSRSGAGLEFGSDAFFKIFYKNFQDFNNDGSSTSTLPNLRLKVTGMRCAAHTLQLAIEDTRKQDTIVGKLLLEVRRVVKTLRTQTFM